ncbi:MAG: hypothetical protein ACI83D_000575 [Planctomycetota bacterium]|jgi:hypothetical protein
MKIPAIIFVVLVLAVGISIYVKNNSDPYVVSQGASVAEEDTLDGSNIFNGEYCFRYELTESGYELVEEIFLDILGGRVIGDKRGYVHGDDYSTSYTGTLFGNIDEDGGVRVIYDFTIEYDAQKEEEWYTLDSGILTRLGYPLVEDQSHGIMRIDEGAAVANPDSAQNQEFLLVDCSPGFAI